MTLDEYKRKPVKDYEATGQHFQIVTQEGKKYVDTGFLTWLTKVIFEADMRVQKLNDELARVIASVDKAKLPEDQLDNGPLPWDEPAVADKKPDLFFGGKI